MSRPSSRVYRFWQITLFGCRSKLNSWGDAGGSHCFHTLRCHFGYQFLEPQPFGASYSSGSPRNTGFLDALRLNASKRMAPSVWYRCCGDLSLTELVWTWPATNGSSAKPRQNGMPLAHAPSTSPGNLYWAASIYNFSSFQAAWARSVSGKKGADLPRASGSAKTAATLRRQTWGFSWSRRQRNLRLSVRPGLGIVDSTSEKCKGICY